MTDDLDELLRLHGEATGGEWQVEEVSRHYADCQIYAPSLGPCRVIVPIASAAARDARHIAAAHNALPGLVERVRRAETRAETMAADASATFAKVGDIEVRNTRDANRLTAIIAERDALREVAEAAKVASDKLFEAITLGVDIDDEERTAYKGLVNAVNAYCKKHCEECAALAKVPR